MPTLSASRDLTLTLTWDEDRLSAALTDSAAIGRLGSVAAEADLLASLSATWAPLQEGKLPLALEVKLPAEQSNPAERVGGLIFSRLLPTSIQRLLTALRGGRLCLQLSENLIALPWELAFDGTDFLGHKFGISRQILTETSVPRPIVTGARGQSDGLRVLIIQGVDRLGINAKAADELLKVLHAIDGVSARGLAADKVGRQQLLRIVGETDIVHYIGSLDDIVWTGERRLEPRGQSPVFLGDVAGLPNPPQLLVLADKPARAAHPGAQNTGHQLAARAYPSGLSTLVLHGSAVELQDQVGMDQLYGALARGSSLGEATGKVTGPKGDGTGGLALLKATLYGCGASVLAQGTGQAAEHDNLRQVTILSYDMVESTALMVSLGAEQYSEVLDRFHRSCIQIVKKWGGIASDPQGNDGIMCYFGLQVAQEDAAAHCLRAAIEILGAVDKQGLRIRIGVVTGTVVVKSGLPVGAAIHFTARLQSIAQPGMTVVSDSTRQIVRDRFDFVQLEHLPILKGFDRPGAAYALIGERKQDNPAFDANPHASPFVGRAHELDLIDTHWAAASRGTLRSLLVSGEAGIGKSRLVREFRGRLAATHHAAVECRCDPDHASSAFYPVIQLLLHRFGIRDGDAQKQRHGKVRAAAATMRLTTDQLAALAVLLSSDEGRGQDANPISSEKQRENTLGMLVQCIEYLAGIAPVFLLFEDVQWIDPSSRDFLKLLALRAAHLPLLVVLTERTELQTRRNPIFPMSSLELKGLSPQATLDMIAGACGAFTPSGQSLQLLIDKADGVPLFIEESAHMMSEVRDGGSIPQDSALTALQFSIPGKVQDLLMARLDRLAGAKQIAQLGGTIGRRFSLSLLQAVLSHEAAPVRIDALASRLQSLVASGMLVERAEDNDTHYHFKHALMRDAAYQSLWERDRRKFHRAIAAVIGEQFPVLAEGQPETLALHFSGAGMGDKAIVHWEKAARLAVSRSAHEESINHLHQGLALVGALPSRTEQDQAELRLQLLLAGQLIATEGYGANQVGKVYQRAADLSLACNDQRAQLKVQLGLEGYHLMRGHFDEAHALAVAAEPLARQSADPMHQVQARYAMANILFHQGDLVSAVSHMDACLADYRGLAHRPGAVQDPGVMCLCYSALAQWELGFPDDALRRAQEVVALAGQLKHKFSLGEALGFRAMVHYFRGELDQALDWAAQAITVCREGGFAVWLAHAQLIHGRALAELGDSQAGIAEMAEGYAMWSSTGAVVTCAFYLSIQAEALALAGRPDDGLVLLERAFTLVSTYSERYYEAEIRRLTGELTLQAAALRGENRDAQAEAWFTGALDAAQSRKLNSLALRSAMSLGRLWLRQSRPAQALAVVQPALAAVHEGHDTCDLVSARQLLADIADCNIRA